MTPVYLSLANPTKLSFLILAVKLKFFEIMKNCTFFAMTKLIKQTRINYA